MVQAAEELVLELEPSQHRRGHDAGPHDLQRDASMRALLFGLVHDPHGPLADEREDSERPMRNGCELPGERRYSVVRASSPGCCDSLSALPVFGTTWVV
jgi:hypothetical protein